MKRTASLLLAFVGLTALAFHASAADPVSGTVVIETNHPYDVLAERLVEAVTDNKMGVVARASATVGAKRVLGLTIPGNQVIMVFHPRFAVRMLEASIPAGIEAPLRYYITERADGRASLSYRTPSAVFGPYHNAALDTMAAELDEIFQRIAAQATQ